MTVKNLSAQAPLSIAVVGVGGIGSTFAYHLAHAGHDLTVVARPGSARLTQLQRDKGVVRDTGEYASMSVAERLDESVPYDLIIVTTLAHQVDAVLPALARSKARCVHFMFNTFQPERLMAAVGADRCTFGMPQVMATVDGDGKLRSSVPQSRKTAHGDERWVALFNASGLPSAYEADMVLWLRCHVPFCIAFESISVAGVRRGGGASWAEAITVARGVKAGFSIIQGLGYRLYPPAKALVGGSPTFVVAAMLWSVSRIASFRELLATGLQECRSLIDLLAAAGSRADPALSNAVRAVLAAKPDDDGQRPSS